MPTVPVHYAMECSREVEGSSYKEPDIGNLSPATKQRLANRRILFGQASARNSRWYQDLVKDTLAQDNTFKPIPVSSHPKKRQSREALLMPCFICWKQVLRASDCTITLQFRNCYVDVRLCLMSVLISFPKCL